MKLKFAVIGVVSMLFVGVAYASVDAGIDAGATVNAVVTNPATPVTTSAVVAVAKAIVDAAQHHNWRYLVALCLGVVVFLLRKYVGNYVPWFKTDRGGAVLVLLVGVLGAVTTVLLSPYSLSMDHIVDAVANAVTAAGGYTILKKVFTKAS